MAHEPEQIIDWFTFTAEEWYSFTDTQWDTFRAYPFYGTYRIAKQGWRVSAVQSNATASGSSNRTTTLDLYTLNATELDSMTAAQLAALVVEPQYGPYYVAAQNWRVLSVQSNATASGSGNGYTGYSRLEDTEYLEVSDEAYLALTDGPTYGPYRIEAQGYSVLSHAQGTK